MRMTSGGYPLGATQKGLTDGVRIYYERQRNDRNLILGADSGIVNHHFGLGDFDRSRPLMELDQDEIARLLHRLEMQQIDALIERLPPIASGARALDAGCGRGGTSIVLAERLGLIVDGVTISRYQQRFASGAAARRGLEGRVRFHEMDYLALAFPDDTFDLVVTNETTQYVLDVNEACREFGRVLRPGGCYANATWCLNEEFAGNNEFEDSINLHYGTSMNTRLEYREALEASGFRSVSVVDLTEQGIPYWELRCHWEHRSGIERAFLEGHRQRKILYLLITAWAG